MHKQVKSDRTYYGRLGCSFEMPYGGRKGATGIFGRLRVKVVLIPGPARSGRMYAMIPLRPVNVRGPRATVIAPVPA